MSAKEQALSQSEIEALLANLQEGGQAPTSPSRHAVSGTQARPYDFRKPDKFSREHIRALLSLIQTFARLVGTQLSGRLRIPISVKVTSIEQSLYEEYVELLPQETFLNVISMQPLEGNLLLQLPNDLAIAMIDRLLGGRGQALDRPHEPTEIEIALLRSVSVGFLDALRDAWANLGTVTPALESIALAPHLAQVAGPSDVVVVALLEAQLGQHVGAFSVAIPAVMLEAVLPRLSTQVWLPASRRQRRVEQARELLAARLMQVPVPVVGVLGEARLSVSDVIGLQAGDVIPLQTCEHGAVRLVVMGQPKFEGRMGLSRRRLAVEVTTVIEEKTDAMIAADGEEDQS